MKDDRMKTTYYGDINVFVPTTPGLSNVTH